MKQTTLRDSKKYNPIPCVELQSAGMTGPTPSSSITPLLQVTIARRIYD